MNVSSTTLLPWDPFHRVIVCNWVIASRHRHYAQDFSWVTRTDGFTSREKLRGESNRGVNIRRLHPHRGACESRTNRGNAPMSHAHAAIRLPYVVKTRDKTVVRVDICEAYPGNFGPYLGCQPVPLRFFCLSETLG